MRGLAVVAMLLAAGGTCAAPVAPAGTPEELYARAAASFDAGDFATADAACAALRAGDPAHRFYWPASLLWARCATDPAVAAARLKEVSIGAPAETRRQCELELAHLHALGERWAPAEAAYAAWLAAYPGDERGDEAGYWRAASLEVLGRGEDAEAEAARVLRQGRQPGPRALAGLLLARLRMARGDRTGAHAAYAELAGAPWGQDVRPQALLGAASTAPNTPVRDPFLRRLVKEHPATIEANEAKVLLGLAKRVPDRIGVQVGAFNNAAKARTVLARFTKRGRKGKVVASQHERFGKLFAVVLGPFPDRARAEVALAEARKTEPSSFIAKF